MGETRHKENLILTGFSFTGKSVVAKDVAKRLGRKLIDSDHRIADIAGKSIPDIFAEDGEEHFRRLEREVLEQACKHKGVVIAIGGGAIVDPRNRELLSVSGVIICLEAEPQTIYERLLASDQGGDAVPRPLLAVEDPMRRIIELKASRQAYYATADWAVYTDDLTQDEVVDEVVRGFEKVCQQRSDSSYSGDIPFVVTTPTQSYSVFVGWGILDDLGRRMRQAGLSGCANIISDENVFPYYGARAASSLVEAGFVVESYSVPPGETTKAIDTAVLIYDWLVSLRTERVHAIVALGGGMVGDLAGFVAATFLRGLPLVHVPTSLIAVADSAIGGKVAVNHPSAKNFIGSFYQPDLVLADVGTLKTLPQRELVSGWGEVIKHGLVLDRGFMEFLEGNVDKLTTLEPKATVKALRHSAWLKAVVVSEDERERERRMVLNYGHTIAHGLEAATGYQRFLHGEAVAIGMIGAAMLSQRLGLIPHGVVERQRKLIEMFGLPTSCSGVSRGDVLKAMELDKKVREKAVKWVLLEDIGRTAFRSDVPLEDVMNVLEELVSD
jgi:shikimate kinase/3-dehydroquinate synthase